MAGTVMCMGSPVHLEGGPGALLVTASERTNPRDDPGLGICRVTDGADGGMLEFLGGCRVAEEGTGPGTDLRDASFSVDGSVLAVTDGARGGVLLGGRGARGRRFQSRRHVVR
ncbi:hypothetical protein DMH12_14900 [Streptomyces sp. WAC 04229]|nr:hypothetical protein DMH12_14900 [Streptomyces sp. WAC 04229]